MFLDEQGLKQGKGWATYLGLIDLWYECQVDKFVNGWNKYSVDGGFECTIILVIHREEEDPDV